MVSIRYTEAALFRSTGLLQPPYFLICFNYYMEWMKHGVFRFIQAQNAVMS